MDITSIEFFAIDKNLESACIICFILSSEVWSSLNRFRRKSQFFDIIQELPINFHSHWSIYLESTSRNTYNIKKYLQCKKCLQCKEISTIYRNTYNRNKYLQCKEIPTIKRNTYNVNKYL